MFYQYFTRTVKVSDNTSRSIEPTLPTIRWPLSWRQHMWSVVWSQRSSSCGWDSWSSKTVLRCSPITTWLWARNSAITCCKPQTLINNELPMDAWTTLFFLKFLSPTTLHLCFYAENVFLFTIFAQHSTSMLLLFICIHLCTDLITYNI